jgi:hypothetical protein
MSAEAHLVISLLRSKFGRIWSEADINHRAGFIRPLGTRCCGRPNSTRWRVLHGVAFPQSIVLRCRVTLPFAELRQMLLVDAIDLGLHLGMPRVRRPAVQSETSRIGFPPPGAWLRDRPGQSVLL